MARVKTTISTNGSVDSKGDNESFLFVVDVPAKFTNTATFTSTSSFSGPVSFSGSVTLTGPSLTPQLITASVILTQPELGSKVFFVSASTAQINVQIPASVTDGLNFYTKRIDSNSQYDLVFSASSGILIDGVATKIITTQYTSIHFMFYNSGWWII